jgi:tight adherence protein B
VLSPAPAGADSVTIRSLDTSKFPTVTVDVVVNGQTPDPSTFNIVENGHYVQHLKAVPVDRASLPLGVVLAIDTSGSMTQAGKMAAARAGALELIDRKQPGDEVAVVGFGQVATVVQPFTTDVAKLHAAVAGLAPSGETALWDGLALAVGQFAGRPDIGADIVLLTDGKDTVSTSTRDAATGAAISRRASVYAVGLAGGQDYDSGALHSVADATGGEAVETSDPSQVVGLYQRVQRSLANRYELTYTSTASSPFDLSVQIGSLSVQRKAVSAGQAQRGPAAAPTIVGPRFAVGPLRHRSAIWLVVGMVFLGALMAAAAIAAIAWRATTTLERKLDPYFAGPGDEDPQDERRSGPWMAGETAISQRAVAMAERLVRDRGLLEKLERRLEQAGVKLRPGELLVFSGAGVLFSSVVTLVLAGPLLGLVALAVAAAVPFVVMRTLASRRQAAFVSQLPDTMALLSSTLRAGFSLLQGMTAVVEEVEEPMKGELRRILVESQLGHPIEQALEDCAARMGSPDFEWAVMAINIQRDIGGNLSELLATVGQTMTQRERLRGEVKALTAEGRMSAIVLGGLPPALAFAMWLMNPDYIGVLFTNHTGRLLVIGVSIWVLFGFWWMKKTITIDI